MIKNDVNKVSFRDVIKWSNSSFNDKSWIDFFNSFLFYDESIDSKIIRLNTIIRKQHSYFLSTNKISYNFIKEINELKSFFLDNFKNLSVNDKTFLRNIFLTGKESNCYVGLNTDQAVLYLDDLLRIELFKKSNSDDLKYILRYFSYWEENSRIYSNFKKHVLFLKTNKTIFQIDFNYLIKLLIGRKCFHVFPDEDSLNYNI